MNETEDEEEEEEECMQHSQTRNVHTHTRKSIDKNRVKRKNGRNRVIATKQQSDHHHSFVSNKITIFV